MSTSYPHFRATSGAETKSHSRVLTALVVSSLVIFSSILAGALNTLQVVVPAQDTYSRVQASTLSFGTLVVKVLTGANSSGSPGGPLVTPVRNEHIWLATTDKQLDRRIFLYTNASGILQLRLVPMSLLVEVLDDRFTLYVPVQIFADQVSTVTIVGSSTNHVISFAEATDPYSTGWVGDSQRVHLEIPATSETVNPGSFIFIETHSSNASATFKAVVLGQERRQDSVWLEVRPYAGIPVSSLVGATVLTYHPSYTLEVSPSKA